MKKIYLTLIIVLSCFVSYGQTSVQVSFFGDSIWSGQCGLPFQTDLIFSGNALNYNPLVDSLDVYINYGDGNDTTFKTNISTGGSNWFGGYVTYTYTVAGSYTSQVIVTAPDLKADTSTLLIYVDHCETISGNVYQDDNGNCVKDGGESAASNLFVSLYRSGVFWGSAYSDVNGDYSFQVPAGTSGYTVGLNGYNNTYNVVCPVSNSITIPSLPSVGNDFGIKCDTTQPIIATVFGAFRPGFCIWNSIRTSYNCSTNGSLCLVVPNHVSANNFQYPPDNISGDTLTWNIVNWDNNYFKACTDTSVALDTSLTGFCYEMIIKDGVNSIQTTHCLPIVNSWDPNMITVSPRGEGTGGDIEADEDLIYTIYFQNTGTAAAYNVYLLDELDVDIDPATIQIIGSSHGMSVEMIESNVIKFRFDNIMLPDSNANEPESHGYVSYRIAQNGGLTPGTEIHNTAEIYFDFNPAVVTNTVLNTIVETNSINETITNKIINIYPNPANEKLTIVLGEFDKANVSLFNTIGQVQFAKTLSSNQSELNISNLVEGVYFIKLEADGVIQTEKIIITH